MRPLNRLHMPRSDASQRCADQQLDLSQIGQELASAIARSIAPAVARSVGVISQAGAALLAFFFFVRDQEIALTTIRRLLPLQASEIDLLFTRVSSAVQSAIYGRLFIGPFAGLPRRRHLRARRLARPCLLGRRDEPPVDSSCTGSIPGLGSGCRISFGGWPLDTRLDHSPLGLLVIHPIDNLLYPCWSARASACIRLFFSSHS